MNCSFAPRDLAVRVGFLFLAAGWLGGCEARSLPKAGEALERQPENRIPAARLRAPLGARQARPVVVALVAEQAGCDRVEESRGEAFLVCLWPSPGRPVAERLRGALLDLKRLYPAHIASGSVSVYVEASQTREGMALVAEEPGFFAGLVLEQADRVLVSNTRLYSYGQKGGKRVALLGVPLEEGQRARGVAPSAQLTVELFPPGAEGLREALLFVREPSAGPPRPLDSANP